MDAIVATRNRTASDAVSGLSLNRADFPDYSDDELVQHFATFSAYDLDSSGYISPENLLEVLTALEVKDASIEMVRNIIAEVAILSEHDNDGKLSFRDYMRCIKYDHEAADHNLALDAQTELRLSVCEEEEVARESGRASVGDVSDAPDGSVITAIPPEAPAEVPAEVVPVEAVPAEEPQRRRRMSSMAAVAAVAATRIKAFQQKANDAKSARDKLAAFRAKPEDLGPIVNSDEMHKETLRNKVKAFETAARFKGTVELKKTWRQVGGSRAYTPAKKLVVGGEPAGPPPKKKITDLP